MSATIRETRLWARLREAGQSVGEPPAHGDTPWYVALLSGTAAWVAAMFLIGFVADGLHWYREQSWAMFALGAACAVFALGAMHLARGRVFIEQLAVASSLGGQLLMGLGLDQIANPMTGTAQMPWMWPMVAAIALAMHAFGRLPLHRFLCGVIFAVGVLGACSDGIPALRVVAVPLLAWLALGAWVRSEAHDRAASVLSPLAWALSLVALLAVGFINLDARHFEDLGAWALWLRPLGDALLLPLLPVCARWLLRRQADVAPRTRMALIVLSCVLALACWRAPGVTLATTLALVGFALHRPVLLVVGLVGIGAYLLRFYFQLDTTLLEKSGWLLAAGAFLLLARVAARRALPVEATP
ncbi:MAG: DUF4401 domain-containing protein [Lysobacteraceae bacterium]